MPFKSTSSLYVFYGRTDDRFCMPDTRFLTLTEYLEEKLLHIGKDRIVFHHPRRGIRVVEQDNLIEDKTNIRNKECSSKENHLVAGPMGQLNIMHQSERKNALSLSRFSMSEIGAKSESRSINRMPDSELPSYLQGFINSSGKKVIVFEDGEHFIQGYNPTAAPQITQLLRDIVSSDYESIISIIIFNYYSTEKLVPRAEDRQHFLHSLQDQFVDGNNLPRGNVIRVATPDTNEIKNTVRRMRLFNNLDINFSVFHKNCEKFAAEVRSRNDLYDIALKHVTFDIKKWDWLNMQHELTALEKLRQLPGREEVAIKLEEDIGFAKRKLEKILRREKDNTSWISRLAGSKSDKCPRGVDLSYAFSGNPGTGKTIIARLIGQIYKESGILSSGHFIEKTVQDLVAEYTGQTALKTAALLDSAMGGVLFIDEVQAFEKSNLFHREAIRVLLKYAEDHRGAISIIVATYPQNLEQFYEIDDGLRRRFSQKIDLDDYDSPIAAEIFRKITEDRDILIASDLDDALVNFFESWITDRRKPRPYDNAGSIVNLIEEMEKRNYGDTDSALEFTIDSIPSDLERYIGQDKIKSSEVYLKEALAELNGLVGLKEVKKSINVIVNRIRANKLRARSTDIVAGHYYFSGAPGTGKTTVARLIGDIFRSLSILKSGHVIETDRSGLVGEYSGQTATKVKALVDEAMDGVLFIDEAHNLVNSQQDGFGKEAIGALTPALENYRDRFCVVLAGYPEEMKRLFAVDPGWKSRFKNQIVFTDYSGNEMADIFRIFCKQNGWTLARPLNEGLSNIMQNLIDNEGDNFANGRSARNLLDIMVTSLDERFIDDPQTIHPTKITLDDVPKELREVLP